jgi:hypothetical protein
MNPNDPIYLLAIRGTPKPKTVDDVRTLHNQTAGNPQGVEAARSLGDLSHLTFVTLPMPGQKVDGVGELLFLDLWNSLEGLNTFFADKNVQEGGGHMFSVRDPAVFAPAKDTFSFTVPAPSHATARYVGIIRGTLRSQTVLREVFDPAIAKGINVARRHGQISHQKYLMVSKPGEPASLEMIGVDFWQDAEGMGKFYMDPAHQLDYGRIFTGKPDTSVWQHGAGQWTEW